MARPAVTAASGSGRLSRSMGAPDGPGRHAARAGGAGGNDGRCSTGAAVGRMRGCCSPWHATKTCAFSISGHVSGPGAVPVTTAGLEAFPGTLAATQDGVTLAVPDGRQHPGCGLVLLPQIARGLDLDLTRRTDWIARTGWSWPVPICTRQRLTASSHEAPPGRRTGPRGPLGSGGCQERKVRRAHRRA